MSLNLCQAVDVQIDFNNGFGAAPQSCKIVKNAVSKQAFEYLKGHMKNVQKGREVKFESFQTSKYLCPKSNLNEKEMKNIFLMRSRNLLVKGNFPTMFTNVKCVAKGCQQDETSKHLYECNIYENRFNNKNVKFEEIFSNKIDSMKFIQKVVMNKFKQREVLLSSLEDPRDPGAESLQGSGNDIVI